VPTSPLFTWLHGRHLVYNTCWEDPRLDRQALALGPGDTVVMITSAGCNALDYALDAPARIFAVDVNPRQNALLELKQAGIRALDHQDFFAIFGEGRSRRFRELYHDALRPQLSDWPRAYWDRRVAYFLGRSGRRSFYFRGTTGLVARAVNAYLDRVAGLRDALAELLEAPTVPDQRDLYDRRVRHRLWGPALRWALGRDLLLWMLAVPRPQREHLERDYGGNIAGFIEDRVETVLTRLPIGDNYFWRVYLTGAYTRDCCPEYLTRAGFDRLKAGLVDRVSVHSTTLLGFLRRCDRPISRFVLLDHMDWLCDEGYAELCAEWQHIVRCAAPEARLLWRSGGTQTRFVDRIVVRWRDRARPLGAMLSYHRDLAARLHARDRVHTYGSFHIAAVPS
jgi:S-adenosylmethionine-diacylglycerol 3-amino-3-carboxypropyl transferase